MPKVKFDFFSVHLSENTSFSFQDALDDMASRATEERSVQIDGATCFLVDTLLRRHYNAYLFTKIRMNELPSVTKINGERELLALEEDEGLGEDVGMAYCSDINIVSIQRNRHSLSANKIAELINALFPELCLQFLPIIREDALERFSRCNTIKKFRLKLSGRENLDFLKESPLSTGEKLMFTEMLSEPYVELTLSVGRKKTGLTEKIKRFVDFFSKTSRSDNSDAVLALEIAGKETEVSPMVVIDLLQDRLIHIDDVRIENRTIDTTHLMHVAAEAIALNYEELSKQ